MIRELAAGNRSYRRFYQERPIDEETLRDLASLTRLCASAANRQPLKYILSCSREGNDAIFPTLTWAAYLKDWPGPAEGERPSGYIVFLLDRRITENPWVDHGIAVQTMLLAAREKGIGGCMFGAIDKKRLAEALRLPDHLEILIVLALGYPKEEVVLEDIGPDGSVRYWRDAAGVHHVPKRRPEDLVIGVI